MDLAGAPSAASLSLLQGRQESAPAPESVSPAQSAVEALIRSNIGGGDPQKPSNPAELAARGGDGSQAPSTRKWEEKDLQAAQAYLGRFGAPSGALDGKLTRDEAIEWGLNLAKMQQGINAKTKAQAERIAELEQSLVKLASGAGKAQPKERNSNGADSAELKALAEELGVESSKIGPALERWLEARLPKAEPVAPKGDDEALREVRELAVGSARTQLQGAFPALQHDAIYADVLEEMKSLNGPRYNALPRGDREVARMRDACRILELGGAGGVGPDKTETRDQVLRSQVPRPQAGPREQTTKTGTDLAKHILAAHGYGR